MFATEWNVCSHVDRRPRHNCQCWNCIHCCCKLGQAVCVIRPDGGLCKWWALHPLGMLLPATGWADVFSL